MDPNEALKNAREAMRDYLATDDAETANNASEILANAFQALDEWLSRGGFLPTAWNRDRMGWVRSEVGPRPGDQDYDDDSTEF